MAAPVPIDELRHRYAAQPRRYLAPLANALRQAGALEEAVTMLRARLTEHPEHLTGHVVLGQALFDTGALAEARTAFEAARALDPGNRVVLRYLGEIASLGGDQAAARLWFGRLRAADPYADDVAAQLGGGPTEPPDAEDDDRSGGAPPMTPAQEVPVQEMPVQAVPVQHIPVQDAQEASRVDAFEPLEFDPVVPDDAAALATAPDASPAPDPVVGLDLAPAEAPLELSAVAGPAQHPDRAGDVDELGDDTDGEGALERITAGPFATETMAGLLAAQGHTEQAIALYERLTAERPGDAGLRSRLDALRGSPSDVIAAATDAGEPRASSPTDAERGALLAAAFADVSRAGGASPDPEVTAVDAAADVGTPAEADPFADVSFDRFFVDTTSDASVERAPDRVVDVPPADVTAPDEDADLARFDRWLRESAA